MPLKKKVRISEQGAQVLAGPGNVQGPVRPTDNERKFRRTGETQTQTTSDNTSNNKSNKKSTPLTALQREGEGRKAFQRRIQDAGGGEAFREPEQLTAEQVLQTQQDIANTQQSLGETVEPSADLPNFSASAQPQVGQIIGAAGAIAGIGAGAALTATGAGAVAGIPTIIASAGTLFGIVSSSIKKDRKKVRADSYKVFLNVKNQNKNLLNMANTGQIPKEDLIEQYKQNLANLREAERRLTILSQGKSGDALENAQSNLFDVRQYLADELRRQQEFSFALELPDVTKVTPFVPETAAEETSSGGLFG